MQQFYESRLIPAEKKPFLIDVSRSSGPLLAISGAESGPRYILDVASQIASKGLGFNAGAMFGAAQFLETWTGNDKTQTIQRIGDSFNELFQKHLQWPTLHTHWCNSGAEANEIALGMCYRQRKHKQAQRVIAFEGAFHGRMMIALASTWNVKKREPFSWEGFETSYASYPTLIDDNITAPIVPEGWAAFWADHVDRPEFESQARTRFDSADQQLQSEIESLLAVRRLALDGRHYAVLIEPMQCEGGDRYSSSRFHIGLANLCRSVSIPLVYDEIQTGLGLGGEFFWHQKFDLRDALDQPLAPDYVILAKKAQVGAVLSHTACSFVQQFSAASLVRGFIHASMIDQFRPEIDFIEEHNRQRLNELIEKYPNHMSRPRVSGLSFAFDFAESETQQKFVNHRFQHGLLYYPAGQRAARFRFNLAFRGHWLDLAWEQITAALQTTLEPSDVPPAPVSVPAPEVQPYIDFHSQFIAGKLGEATCDPVKFLSQQLANLQIDAQVVVLNNDNWTTYRQQVWDLQGIIYEPLRQTAIEKFDKLVSAENSLAIVVAQNDRIISMAFAAPPANFPGENGLSADPHFEDPQTVYMLDLTVVPEHRGKLGRLMKQAMCLLAQSKGLDAIQGRNRDRLARGMWAINLSLGSFCTRILKDDYQDEHAFGDCLMYRCPMTWADSPLYMSNAVHQPLEMADLDAKFCSDNLSNLTNKLTLSNFVTESYLQQLSDVFQLLPQRLRHGYSASGMSECVDKLVKSIWLKRKPRRKLIVVGDGFFGHGSFLSRALSDAGDCLFEAMRIANDDNAIQVLQQELAADETLAVFVEPLGCLTGKRIDQQRLRDLSEVCQKHETPLVTHDSAGLCHRYDPNYFLPSAVPGFTPDAGMMFLGGQMAVCYLSQDYFVDTPLMLISTWDGDVFSLAQFHRTMRQCQAEDMPALLTKFQERLLEKLESTAGDLQHELIGGCGWFRGTVPSQISSMFRQPESNLFISSPSLGAIKRFLKTDVLK